MRAVRLLIVAFPLILAGCGSKSDQAARPDPPVALDRASEERYDDAMRLYHKALKNAAQINRDRIDQTPAG